MPTYYKRVTKRGSEQCWEVCKSQSITGAMREAMKFAANSEIYEIVEIGVLRQCKVLPIACRMNVSHAKWSKI